MLDVCVGGLKQNGMIDDGGSDEPKVVFILSGDRAMSVGWGGDGEGGGGGKHQERKFGKHVDGSMK